MKLAKIVFLLFATIVVLPVFAAGATVVIGDTSIEVPPFKDLHNAYPDALTMVTRMASAPRQSAKFLALFLPKEVIAESNASDNIVYAQHFAVATVRKSSVNSKYSLADFARIQESVRAEAKADTSGVPSSLNGTDWAKSEGIQAKRFTMGAIISRSPRHISVSASLSGSNAGDPETIDGFTVVTLILVRGKVINIQTTYLNPTVADFEDAAVDAARWANSIVALNER